MRALKKALGFSVVHFFVGITVAFALTGRKRASARTSVDGGDEVFGGGDNRLDDLHVVAIERAHRVAARPGLVQQSFHWIQWHYYYLLTIL